MGKGAYVLLYKMDMGLPTTYCCTEFFSVVSRLLTKGYMKQGGVLCCVESIPGLLSTSSTRQQLQNMASSE